MDTSQFSEQTLRFLQQFGADLPSAIAAAPDAELQRVSAGYREARAQMGEQEAKALMLGEPANDPARQEEPAARPQSEREQALARMLEFAQLPEARALIESELATEQATQELLTLTAAADAMGDATLAEQFGAMLAQIAGVADAPDEEAADPESPELTEDESRWLAEMDAVAQQSAEPLGAAPEAESQAPASEAGDAGVAPGQGGAEPQPDPAVLADKLKSAWGAT